MNRYDILKPVEAIVLIRKIMKDIKTIPFEELPLALEELYMDKRNTHLAAMKAKITASNKRAIARLLSYDNYEEGSDGREEEAYEALPGLPDPSKAEISQETDDELFLEAKEEAAIAFVKRYNLGSNYSWVLPQMVAHFGNMKAIKDDKGVYWGSYTYNELTEDPRSNGMLLVSMLPRGELIKCPPNSKTQKHYLLNTINHLVPLVLAGFKMSQNIPYSAWNRAAVRHLVNKDLYWGMVSQVPKDMPAEAKLRLRNHGLTNRSGGKDFGPTWKSNLSHLESYTEYDITKCSNLGLVMLTQIWCAHPDNRNPTYQILDPLDWDNVPEPLIEADIVVPKRKYPSVTPMAPWERAL